MAAGVQEGDCGRGEGAQCCQRGRHHEENPGQQHRLAPDEADAGLDDDVDRAVPLSHAEEVSDRANSSPAILDTALLGQADGSVTTHTF